MTGQNSDPATPLPGDPSTPSPEGESEEDEAERKRRAALLGLSLPALAELASPPAAGGVPVIQGAPQVGNIPVVHGTPGGAPAMPGQGAPSTSPNVTEQAFQKPQPQPHKLPKRHKAPKHPRPPKHPRVPRHGLQHIFHGAPSGVLNWVVATAVITALVVGGLVTVGLTFLAPNLSLSGGTNVTSGGILKIHGEHFIPNSSVTLTIDNGTPLYVTNVTQNAQPGAAASQQGNAATQQSNSDAIIQQPANPQVSDKAHRGTLQFRKTKFHSTHALHDPLLQPARSNVITVHGDGTFTISIQTDISLGAGQHTIHAAESVTHRTANLTFTVFGVTITGPTATPPPVTPTATPTQTPTTTPTTTPTVTPTQAPLVTPPAPFLSCATPGTLALGPVQAKSTQGASGSVALCSTGTGAVVWSSSHTSAPWLTVTPGSGTFQAPATIHVTVNASAANLPAGTYHSTITFSSVGSTTTQAVNVTFTVLADCIMATPLTLDFTGAAGGANPAPQAVKVTNCGLTHAWTATITNPNNWLSISPTSGTLHTGASTPITVTTAIGTAELAVGDYQDTIVVQIGNASATVTVNLHVLPLPTIGVSPTSLDAGTASQCSFDTGKQISNCTVTLTNQSTGLPLTWSSTTNQGATVNPANGTITAPGGTASVTISVPLSLCGTDTITNVATFIAPGNQVPVTWICNVAQPPLGVSPTKLDANASPCTFDVPNQLSNCQVTLTNPSSVLNLSWSDTTANGATVQAPGNVTIIKPNTSETVTLVVPLTDCNNPKIAGSTFATFNGPVNSTGVSWTCSVTPPQLTVSPTSLDASAAPCKFDTANQVSNCTVTLSNPSSPTNVLDLNWTDTTLQGVTVQAPNMTVKVGQPETVTISVPLSNCNRDSSSSLTVATFHGPANSVSVDWVCNVPQPVLGVSPTTLDASKAPCTLNVLKQISECPVTLSNPAASILKLDWTGNVANGATLDLSKGTIVPNGSATVTISVPLSLCDTDGSIVVTTFNGPANSQDVTWACNIALPQLKVSPTNLDATTSPQCTFDTGKQLSNCTVTLTNSSPTLDLNWSATTAQGVNVLAPSHAVVAGGTETVTIQIPLSYCPAGSESPVTTTFNGPANLVNVNWTCGLSQPSIGVSPTSLDASQSPCSFDANMTVSNCTVTLTNPATNTILNLNWTATTSNRATVNLSNGTIAPQGSQKVIVTIPLSLCDTTAITVATFTGPDGTPVNVTWTCTIPLLGIIGGPCNPDDIPNQVSVCPVTLTNSSSTQPLPWTVSMIQGVTVQPLSGTITGGSEPITITVPLSDCVNAQNGLLVATFSGPFNTFDVFWTCNEPPPMLSASLSCDTTCFVTLTNSSGDINLPWSVTTPAGVVVKPTSDTIRAGGSEQVAIIIPQSYCTGAVVTVATFAGPANKVGVTFQCSPPGGTPTP